MHDRGVTRQPLGHENGVGFYMLLSIFYFFDRIYNFQMHRPEGRPITQGAWNIGESDQINETKINK
jgi:hypothetical protein